MYYFATRILETEHASIDLRSSCLSLKTIVIVFKIVGLNIILKQIRTIAILCLATVDDLLDKLI